jgi:beta-lactamase regulating signal transducer with metallopeptidase domain/exonuclease VII small subunit
MTRTLLSIGLTNAVLAGLLAMAVALLARLFRSRPALVHGLWLLVLLKLISPPLLSPELALLADDHPETGEESAGDHPGELLDEPVPANTAIAVPEMASSEEVHESPAVTSRRLDGADLLIGMWLAGALGYWGIAGWRLLRLCRALKDLPAASGELQERVDRLAARLELRRPPRAWLLPGQMPPMILVLGRVSRLVLPQELWRALDETQRDTLILHELAHLRRGDHRVRRLELLVLGLYWWNPVAWWCSRALRDVEEQCCDAWVVWVAPSAAALYAAALVETVAYLSAAPAPLPAGASGAGPVRQIKRRLTMILSGSTPRRLSGASLALLLLFGLGLLPVAPTIAQSGSTKAGSLQPPPQPSKPPAWAGQPILMPPSKIPGHPIMSRELIHLRPCQSCHQPAKPQAQKAETSDLHAEVVKLLAERDTLRKRLQQTEARLQDALKRFEKQQPKSPAADDRLEKVEKNLKRLLEEVESLRRELKPGKKTPGKAAPGGAP